MMPHSVSFGASRARMHTRATQPIAIQKPHPSLRLTKPSASSSDWRSRSWLRTSSSMVTAVSYALLAGSRSRLSLSDGSGMANPGVEDGVEHVDGEVDEHVGHGDHDDGALEGHVV